MATSDEHEVRRSVLGDGHLGSIIDYLREQPDDTMYDFGFNSPHSNRGNYRDLSVLYQPEQMSAGDMLTVLKPCVNKTFEGYKGGDFMMSEYTDVYLVGYMFAGYGTTLSPFVLELAKIRG